MDSRREWRAFREYYTEYLPREMPLATPPTVCQGPIAYKGQALLEKDLTTFKAALQGVTVAEAFVPAIAPAMVGRGQNRYYKTEEEYVFAIAEALRDGVPGHRGRRLHPADRRSRSGRDVGHADPGPAARGVPARRRRATSRH